jgi:hypothetical protein
MTRHQSTKERRREGMQPAPNLASNFLCRFADIRTAYRRLRPVLYLRVSHQNQVADGTLDNHEDWLFARFFRLGIKPYGIVSCQEHGWDVTKRGREGFVDACRCAARIEQPLVAIGPSRILRCRSWSLWDQCALPTEHRYWELLKITRGAMLTTWLPPEATNQDEHAIYSTLKANPGGRRMRPKHRRKKLRRTALAMLDEGYSLREVGKKLRVPHTTVKDWRERSR